MVHDLDEGRRRQSTARPAANRLASLSKLHSGTRTFKQFVFAGLSGLEKIDEPDSDRLSLGRTGRIRRLSISAPPYKGESAMLAPKQRCP